MVSGSGEEGMTVTRCSGRRAWLDGETHTCSKSSQHIDERIRTEEIDAPAEEIADTRLGHAKHLCCRFLLDTA